MENTNSNACRSFQLTIISARNLKNVRKFFGMKVYAKISFNGIKKTEKRTPVDKNNGINPAWNFRTVYNISESSLQNDGLVLVVKLYCKRKAGSDKYISEVHAPVRYLFNYSIPQNHSASLCLNLMKGSAPLPNSVINISYRFGDRIEVRESPLWQQVLKCGAILLFRVTMISITGVDVPIPIVKKSRIIT